MGTFAEIIEDHISRHGGQAEVARKLGISPQRLQQYRQGRQKPKLDFFTKWREVFGEDLMYESTNVNESPLTYNRGEFYQELVETNSDYRLIPKSIIEGDYRIILKTELDEMNRTRDLIIAAKDQTIALLERRITDLERINTEAQTVKK